MYNKFVCCNGELFVFDDATGIWTSKQEIIFKIISRYDEHLYILTTDMKGEIKKSKKGYGNTTTLMRQMLPQLNPLCVNNDWIKQSQFSSIGKLLYLNGIYDMKTGIFTEGFNADIVFYYKIYRNYDE